MSETFCRVLILPATKELVTSDWFFEDAFDMGVDSGDESGEIVICNCILRFVVLSQLV